MKKELLEKLKALSERGVGGERENAQALLTRLMNEHGLTEEDLDEDIVKEFDIVPPKIINGVRLLSQVVYSVVYDVKENNKGLYSWKGKKKAYFVRCTSEEFLEIQAKLGFYLYHYENELEIFYSAFIQRNELFPKDSFDSSPLTEKDIQALKLAKSLDKHDYVLQIEGGAK